MLVLLALSAALAEAPDVVVTGTRVEQDPHDVARSITVIEEQDPTDRDLPELLEQAPGVHMQLTNRGSGAPFLRGQVGPQNLVLVDGLAHNLSTYRTGPNQYLAVVDPFGDRIEIVRGPSSVLYGNGAMGGVIHVQSQPIGTGARLRATGTAASADASAGGRFLADLGNDTVGGRIGASSTRYGKLRTGDGHIEPLSDFSRHTWRAELRANPTTEQELSVSTRGVLLQNAGRTDALPEGEVRFYDNTDSLTSARWTLRPGTLVERIQASAGWHHWVETQDRYGCEADDSGLVDRAGCLDRTAIDGESQRRDTVDAAVIAADVAMRPHETVQLVAGVDGQLEWVGSTRSDRAPGEDWIERDRGNFSAGSRYRTAGAFVHGDLAVVRLDAGELHLRGGARLSHFGAHAAGVPQPNAAGETTLQTVQYAHTGVIGSAGASFITDQLHVWTGLTQGFRAPNLEETTLFGPEESRFSVPNPDLKPERSDTAELGARLRTPLLSFATTGWLTRIENALDDAPTTWLGEVENPDGLVYSHRVNVPGARYAGIEAEAATEVDWLTASAHFAATRGRTVDSDTKTPARRVPPASGGLRLRADPATLPAWFEVGVRAAAPQTQLSGGDESDLRICAIDAFAPVTYADLGEDCPGTPGWWTLDVKTNFTLAPGVDAVVAVRNLLDRSYRTHGSGIDAPGIDVRAAIHASWERR